MIERIFRLWKARRPHGGVIQTVARDLHRDPEIRLRKH